MAFISRVKANIIRWNNVGMGHCVCLFVICEYISTEIHLRREARCVLNLHYKPTTLSPRLPEMKHTFRAIYVVRNNCPTKVC